MESSNSEENKILENSEKKTTQYFIMELLASITAWIFWGFNCQ